MKKSHLWALLVVMAGIVLAFGLHNSLSLPALKSSLNDLLAIRDQHPFGFGVAFFMVYCLAGALCLPVMALLTLAAGALLGFTEGVIVVSFASSIGATLGFWASRYLLRDRLMKRFGDKLRTMNEGMERDGAFYLFSLRLIPVFPYFMVNLVMGLTPIRTRTFYLVSQIGMLLVTIVYVNAGTQLARLDSLSGIMSPPLIASFVLLALLPWMAKLALEAWKKALPVKP
ncbi:MAG: VTT domain-containing protein [Asticcacaulis sp.]